MKMKSESEVTQSCLTLSDPWTAAYQPPPSMGFSRQEYWSRVPLPSPADGDCSHEIKRRLLLGRKVMTNLDSIFKSRDITLSTKICLVKAMVFPVVMYGCESWTVKKAAAAAAAASFQLCPTLCDPIDGSPPDSPIPGIVQARTLEWVAISFSDA